MVLSVDLQSALSLGNVAITPNQATTLSAVVSELSGNTANNVVLRILLPTGSTNIALEDSFPFGERDCSVADAVISCNVGRGTGPGRIAMLSVSYDAPSIEGNYPVTVSATTSDDDVDTRNNTVSENQLITTTQADVSVSQVADPEPVYGQSFSYLINVTNNGPIAAENVSVHDELPPEVTLESVVIVSGEGSCASGISIVDCTLTSLAVSNRSPAIIRINARMSAADPDAPPITITNITTVSFDGDYDARNNTSRLESLVREPSADLATSLIPLPTLGTRQQGFEWLPFCVRCAPPVLQPVATNETFIYFLDLFNFGPTFAENVVVTEQLPPGVEFQSWENNRYYKLSTEPGSPITTKFDVVGCEVSGDVSSGQVFTCAIPRIVAQSSASLQLTVRAPSTPGVVGGSVSITSDTPDPDLRNNGGIFQNTTLEPIADLAIDASLSPRTVGTGDRFVYRIAAFNNTGSLSVFPPPPSPTTTAFNVIVTVSLPEGVSVESLDVASGEEFSCSVDGASGRDVVTCTVPRIVAGHSAEEIHLTVRAPNTPTTLHLSAIITSDTSDPVPSNNRASCETTVVEPVADQSVEVLSPEAVTVGDTFSYFLLVSNSGRRAATNVTLTDTLPDGVQFISAEMNGVNPCRESAGIVRCEFGTIEPGVFLFPLSIQVQAVAVGDWTNRVTIGGSEEDANIDNNRDEVQTIVVARPALTRTTIAVHDLNERDVTSGAVPAGAPIHSSAVVTAEGRAASGGTLTYLLFSGPDCRNLIDSERATLTQAGMVPESRTQTLRAGDYSYRAEYDGDNNYLRSTSNCAPFSVEPLRTIESVVINDGTSQRSMVNRIVVTFSGQVSLDARSFELVKQSGGVTSLNIATKVVDDKTVAILTFSHRDIIGGSLADGQYSLLIHGDRIHDAFGRTVDADEDGRAGGIEIDEFFRLFGDSDGDGDVDGVDRDRFRSTFRKSAFDPGFLWFFDFDGDGRVDGRDNSQFNRRRR
jgi:uncharacterized repeat protein (TIGR01451 family)